MIIKKLRLENFGVFTGSHEIDLSPTSRERTIVLFGGLNGGGKTTILDAIQLTLFGKLSRCSTRGSLSYDEFLRRCISHGTPANQKTRVSLEIRQSFDAETHDFNISREWFASEKGIAETLLVQKDSVTDLNMAENWLEHVDQFIPVGLAELFFFDGEQIARIAEADNSAQMLSTAINTLLGIDLVDRLERDLIIYERQISKTQQNFEQSTEVTTLEERVKSSGEELKRLLFEKGRVQNELDLAQRRVDNLEADFQREGGDLFSRRQQLTIKSDLVREQIKRIEIDMREIAAGAAPLLMLEEQVHKVHIQAQREQTAETQRTLLGELEKRDRMIANQIKQDAVPRVTLQRIESLLFQDRKRRTQEVKTERYLNLERSALSSLQHLTSRFLEEIRNRTEALIKERAQLHEQVLDLEGAFTRIADQASATQVSERLSAAQKLLLQKKAEIGVLQERIEIVRRRIDDDERKIASILEQNLSAQDDLDDASRKIRFSARARATMKLFRIKVLERKIAQIEGLILESFQQLLRKKDLVSSIRIDPQNYRMTLIGGNGISLHADRLSAGERQLLAVSILWGLARASGRPLPTIIDTPLGRLDSHHRVNLVENYFPHASHQVIILSTDEEIGKKHFDTLKPYIAKSFELTYSPKSRSSQAVPGYFFDHDAHR